ncbi:hypothetical protein SK128_002222, partial [Halocaridina rubra]
QLRILDACVGSREKSLACKDCFKKTTCKSKFEKNIANRDKIESIPPSNIETENNSDTYAAEESPNTIYLIDNVNIKEERCDTGSEENYNIENDGN